MPLVSVVLPCFHRAFDLFSACEHSVLYTDPRCELVLSLDENSEESLYHQWANRNSRRFRVRILVSDKAHGWRPPSVAINQGIVQSRGRYCIVQSPETVAMFPHVNYLFETIDAQERPFFLTGLLISAKVHQIRDGESYRKLYRDGFGRATKGFGWILFDRKTTLSIGGWDESRTTYGQDDDDFRRRLELSGCRPVNDPAIRVVHTDRQTCDRDTSNMQPFENTPVRLKMGAETFRKSFDWLDL